MPQFYWYTCWMSLGAYGMPDYMIKEGLKQPDCIKIYFEKEAKEITGHSRITRLSLALSTSSHSCSLISSQRF